MFVPKLARSYRYVFGFSIALVGCADPVTPKPAAPAQPIASVAPQVAGAPIGIAKNATWVLHIDAARVRKDDILKVALSKAPFISQLMMALESKCGFAPLRVIDRVLASGMPGKQLFAMHVATTFDGSECFAKLAIKPPTDPRMTPVDADLVAASAPGAVFVGHPSLVREALDGEFGPERSFPSSSIVVFDVTPASNPPIQHFAATIHTTNAALGGEIVFKTNEQRSAISGKAPFDSLLAKSALSGAGPSGADADLTTEGFVVRWAPALKEPARDGGIVAALGVLAANVYLRLEKTHEARTTLQQAAERLFASLKDDAAAGKKVACPPSPPAVPAAVPTGQRFYVRPADWAHPTWQKLGPPSLELAFYQYAVSTSPNGRACTVSAKGDLNGDGVTSEFRVPIDIGTGKPVMGALEIDREIE